MDNRLSVISIILLLVIAIIIKIMPYVLFGYLPFYVPSLDDVTNHARWAMIIDNTNHIPIYDDYLNPSIERRITYPLGFHVFVVILAKTLGIDYYLILRIVPLIISAFTIIIIYIYMKKIYSPQTAVITSLLFAVYAIIETVYIIDGGYARIFALFGLFTALYFIEEKKYIAAFFMVSFIAAVHFYIFIMALLVVILAFTNAKKLLSGSINFIKKLNIIKVAVISILTFYFIWGVLRNLPTLFGQIITIGGGILATLGVTANFAAFNSIADVTTMFIAQYSRYLILVFFAVIGVIYLLKIKNSKKPLQLPMYWFFALLTFALIIPFFGTTNTAYRLVREISVPLMILSAIGIQTIIELKSTKIKSKYESMTRFYLTLSIFAILLFTYLTTISIIFIIGITFSALFAICIRITDKSANGKKAIYAAVLLSTLTTIFILSTFNWYPTPTYNRVHISDYTGMIWIAKYTKSSSIIMGNSSHMTTYWIPLFSDRDTYFMKYFGLVELNTPTADKYLLLCSYTYGWIPTSAVRYVDRESFDGNSSYVKVYSGWNKTDIYYLLPTI
ncbi:MAG: hypothetical protein ACTSQY_08055 [Candidatus Odinarchaeia archaeon]